MDFNEIKRLAFLKKICWFITTPKTLNGYELLMNIVFPNRNIIKSYRNNFFYPACCL